MIYSSERKHTISEFFILDLCGLALLLLSVISWLFPREEVLSQAFLLLTNMVPNVIFSEKTGKPSQEFHHLRVLLLLLLLPHVILSSRYCIFFVLHPEDVRRNSSICWRYLTSSLQSRGQGTPDPAFSGWLTPWWMTIFLKGNRPVRQVRARPHSIA